MASLEGWRSSSPMPAWDSRNWLITAAVRARAAANGLTVTPRGRIEDEVIQAYRAAGN
jgi:hypothetical protein